MTINIKLPAARPAIGQDELDANGDRPVTGWGTRVFNDHGDEITGVTRIDISISQDAIVTATVEVAVSSNTDMDNIHALLGTKTLEDVLKLHGVTDYSIGRPSAKDRSEYD